MIPRWPLIPRVSIYTWRSSVTTPWLSRVSLWAWKTRGTLWAWYIDPSHQTWRSIGSWKPYNTSRPREPRLAWGASISSISFEWLSHNPKYISRWTRRTSVSLFTQPSCHPWISWITSTARPPLESKLPRVTIFPWFSF